MTRADAAEIYQLHARICQALADPKRLLIINELRSGSRSVGELAASLELSQPNTSQHLAVLKERGIVVARRAGSNVHYSLRGDQVLTALDLLRDFMVDDLEQRSQAARDSQKPG
jgi:ArsR family transcriptional regulator